jgi:hypothetical protein
MGDEPMSDIQSLTLRVQDLTRSVDWWNNAMLWTLIFVAIAAVAVAITTLKVITKTKELSSAQARLDKEKEGKLETELTDKGLKIEELKSETASLLKQLMAQGPRSYLLYGEARDKFVEALSPFPRQSVEIRYCDTAFNQISSVGDVFAVMALLDGIFTKAERLVMPGVRENCGGSGISVAVDPKASTRTKKASEALVSTLLAVPLAVVGNKVFVTESPRNLPQPRVFLEGRETTLPPLRDTIVLTVLAHP